jgi:hypothetical protein
MPENDEPRRPGHFIGAELRPPTALDLTSEAPLPPGASRAEIERRARAILDEEERECLAPEPTDAIWQTVFARSPQVTWRVLDREAILLDTRSYRSCSLNRVGTAIWELLAGEQTLEAVLGGIGRRFNAPEALLRRDLLSLITQLQRAGLVEERR